MAGLHPVVVVTGATGAIGSATASVLVRRGARVLLLARPSDRLSAAVKRLGGEENRVSSVPVDLSSLSSVRSAAREITRTVGHVDALLNVAATFSREYHKTKEGFELMLATNHLGPFLLTNLLRDRLVGRGRVITVTAPSSTRVDLDRLMVKASIESRRARRSHAELPCAPDLWGHESRQPALHVRARSPRQAMGGARQRMSPRPRPLGADARGLGADPVVTRMVSRPPARAAEDLADLAISPAHEGTTGWFFKGTKRIEPPKSTLDQQAQSALWKRTAELVELENAGF